jgi:isocitrate dehydrogenase
VKCATITPDGERQKEFGLKQIWKSPNGTIREILNGTVFREPILVEGFPSLIPHWKQPIIIGRHAYGDQYSAKDLRVDIGSRVKIVVESPGKEATEILLKDFEKVRGVVMGMHNTEDSIRSFAESCFKFSLDKKMPLVLSTKNTILRQYDGLFKEVFDQLYTEKYRTEFE